MEKTAKQKKAEEAIKKLEGRYGKNTIVRVGDNPIEDIQTIPSGHPGVDEAIGIKGLPRGRIIEVFGPEGNGKTTMGLLSIAATQKAGGICAFIDAEYSLDLKWAKSLGVDIENLYTNQPEYGEQALEIVETLATSDGYDLIVIDSVAALVPKEEMEGNLDEKTRIICQARMMSDKLRRLTPAIGSSNCVVIFINQVRTKVGQMYGNPDDTPGGRALKFYASLRLKVSKVFNSNIKKTVDGKSKIIGHRVKVDVRKNKVAPPFKRVEVDVIFGEGISKELDLLDAALAYDIVQKSGAWFTFGKERVAQGRDNCLSKLKIDEDLLTASRVMAEHNVTKLVVIRNEILYGIITEKIIAHRCGNYVDQSIKDTIRWFTPLGV